MNLGKRTSLLILPVIIISYTMIAWIIYERESRSLQALEKNRLEQRASLIGFTFNAYNNFLDTYLTSLTEGNVLAAYLRNTNNVYREKMLTGHLEAAISRGRQGRQTFASLSIFDSNNALKLYIENSTDPFATIRPEQIRIATEMVNQKLRKKWEHTTSDNGQSAIRQGTAIDAKTLLTPTLLQAESTYRIIVTARPDKFDDLLKTTQTEYQAKLRYFGIDNPLETPPQGLSATVKLSQNYSLLIQPSETYLASLLSQLQIRLLASMAAGVLITFILLQLLIRRYITNPIVRLDEQLTDVIARKKDNIDFPYAEDEVGRLGRKFHDLYEKLNQAFQESFLQARIDALTQLPNRVGFHEAAEKLLLDAEKHQQQFSIIYIDIDNFKFVNDKYGHEIGDELLKAIAAKFNHLITIALKRDDMPFVYRLSGDEFIIILPEYDSNSASQICNKILKLFTNGFNFERGHFAVTASLGLASFPQDGSSITQLISNADLAMYQAKNTGKNRLAHYSNELAKNDRQLKEIEFLLKEINPHEELSLNYMPVIDHADNVKGCEALLRWHSPQIGPVSPAVFIPIAEETGVFEMIDLWVIEQSFKDYPQLQNILGEALQVSINISSAEVHSDNFIHKLKALCHQYSITPGNFILEITETFAMEQSSKAIQWLERLRLLGFKIAIDDFGTGYTSLMQMVDYPVDIIKFDKQLVERITQTERRHLAKALIDLCHIQSIQVVAEGIETSEQSRCLWQADCDIQQGFLIAKPMPIGTLKNWLEEHSYLERVV
ncbi:putative bifunctional diguanylate cyclase/phosphodiesterase [Aliamphritea hakodatensis]|uniref:putative bifunctional diguanylate cyclase/phosphodiesterase n=1 Tax=Aliamphritea hakodatensis TaxID=2895352 RepID=UPI0022FD6297|nr:bifunctional diguanylate cyclase/phosphodiesterase [Aliamphritea hakodatensis]